MFLLTEFGSRREIFLYYADNEGLISLDEIIVCVVSNFCKWLFLDSVKIDYLQKDAFNFAGTMDFSHIKFLD